MAFVGAGLADQQRALLGFDELQRGELEYLAFGDLGLYARSRSVRSLRSGKPDSAKRRSSSRDPEGPQLVSVLGGNKRSAPAHYSGWP